MSFPALPAEYPTPQTVAEGIAALHHSSERMATAADKLLELAEMREETPEMHTVVINDGNTGSYQTLDRSTWRAKSIGVLNPGAAPVYIGVAGLSATAAARVPSCPGSSALVLPLEADDILFGCDSGTLGANTAVIYVFRYVSLQPLVLRQVP